MNDVLPRSQVSEEEMGKRLAVKLMNREELYEQYYRLVIKFVNQYIGQDQQEYDDCLSEAFLGLLKAQEKYDPTRAKFTTCLKFWVRAYVGKFLSKERQLFPENSRDADLRRRMDYALLQAEIKGEEFADLNSLAETIGVKLEAIQNFRQKTNVRAVQLSLTGASMDDRPGEIELADEDAIPTDELAVLKQQKERVQRLLRAQFLSQRDIDILSAKFYKDKDNSAIGRDLGISRERVRQILRNLYPRLKAEL